MSDGERLNARAVAAPPSAESATPNRIRVSGSRRRPARMATMAPAARAPDMAASSITPGVLARPSAMIVAAPSAAKADTPSTPGSASGLRSRPCMTAPARPSSAPTRAAATALGARSPQRISPTAVAGWTIAWAYCATLSGVSPKATASARLAARMKIKSRMRRMAYRLEGVGWARAQVARSRAPSATNQAGQPRIAPGSDTLARPATRRLSASSRPTLQRSVASMF